MPKRPGAFFAVLLLVLTCPLWAGDDATDIWTADAIDGPPPPEPPDVVARDVEGRVTLRAVGLDEPLVVDGRLEENIYRLVPSVDGFIQQEPHEGEPATEKTEIWVFYDGKNLYVSARCWDSGPERMVANEMRRDNRNILNNENFAVILDTFYDRRNGFLFHTNPLGALWDGQITDERNTNSDWNTVWDVKTGRFAQGWTVEMVLPFKSLRYQEGGSQIWGINFRRIVRWKNEWSYLTPIAAAYRRQGILKLSSAATLVGVEPPSQSRNFELKPYATSGLRTDKDADPQVINKLGGDVGLDVKYGVTRSLIFDFTYNTDFAQVEDDEQQVNLTRFGLFFPEKRDFFLEGQGIFGFGGRQTRRFGGSSQDTPILFFSRRIGLSDGEAVPIQVGGRLTGRAGKYTLGLLNLQANALPEVGVPATNFSVLRVKRDLFRRSNFGIIATHRSPAMDDKGSSSVFGVDANFSFLQNLNVNTYYARTRTPDRVGSDSSYRGRFHYGGDRYGIELERLVVEENFNPEIGFLRRKDFRRSFAKLRFSPRPRSLRAVRKFSYEASIDYFTDGEGTLETREAQFEFRTDLESGDNFTIQYTGNFEYLEEDFEIADGVVIPVGDYRFQRVRFSYWFGPQRPISAWANFERGSFFGGHRTELGYFGRVEISPRLSIEPRVSLNWVDLPEGRFATQLLRGRVNYTFSPRAFLGTLIQYNSSNNSLSTNVRFRWEYEPGSDLFVVYSDGRNTLARGIPEIENRSLVVKFTRLFRF